MSGRGELFEIRQDAFMPITFDSGERHLVNAKFDRIDAFYDVSGRIGHYALKIWDDAEGFMTAHIGEDMVHRIVTAMERQGMEPLPVVPRTTMFNSEHEGYLESRAALLDDNQFDFTEIDEQAIEADVMRQILEDEQNGNDNDQDSVD